MLRVLGADHRQSSHPAKEKTSPLTNEPPPRPQAETVRAARVLLPGAPRAALRGVVVPAASQKATPPTRCYQMNSETTERHQIPGPVTSQPLRIGTPPLLSHQNAFSQIPDRRHGDRNGEVSPPCRPHSQAMACVEGK